MAFDARPGRTLARLALGLLVALAAREALSAQQQQPLTFRSMTELVAVGVQVIDKIGQPIAGLTGDDFQVAINGRPRRVVSADLVTYPVLAARRAALMASVGLVRPGAAGGVVPDMPNDVTGRVIVIAVDEASLSLQGARQAMNAAKKFVNALEREDVVGVYAFPFGVPKVDLQHDHFRVSLQLDKVTGRFSKPASSNNLSLGEIVDITSGELGALDRAAERECHPLVITDAMSRQACIRGVYLDAFTSAQYLETQYMQSLGDFRELLEGLATVPGRKTVIYVSGGLAVADRAGGRPDVNSMLKGAVAAATMADINLYAIHVDSGLADAFSPAAKPRTAVPGGVELPDFVAGRNITMSRDISANATGLERLAGEAGGAVFRDQVGAGEFAFDRILRETSAFYLLGVESTAADRDGRVHYIRVKTNVKNATIRARTQVVIPRARK